MKDDTYKSPDCDDCKFREVEARNTCYLCKDLSKYQPHYSVLEKEIDSLTKKLETSVKALEKYASVENSETARL